MRFNFLKPLKYRNKQMTTMSELREKRLKNNASTQLCWGTPTRKENRDDVFKARAVFLFYKIIYNKDGYTAYHPTTNMALDKPFHTLQEAQDEAQDHWHEVLFNHGLIKT